MTVAAGREIKLVVISAGLSQPSSSRLLADRLAAATSMSLAERGVQAQIEVVEVREWARDLTNQLVTGFASAGLRRVLDRVGAADALIAVSPIFSASYSGLFKTFFDVLDPSALAGLPVLIAATGGSARHSLALEHALRPLFSYLRATVVPTAVYAASQDWATEGELVARIDLASRELTQLVLPEADSSTRAPGLAGECAEAVAAGEVVPFTRLLAAQRDAAAQRA